MSATPSVDQARPSRCPSCTHASREPGRNLGLHGHGLRCRQIRGPLEPGRIAGVAEVKLRRYRCQRCGVVVAVGPDGLLHRRFFTATAIAFALAAWALGHETDAAVRAQINPWRLVGVTTLCRWNALRSWARAAALGRLWPSIVIDADWTRRELARRVTLILADRGPPGDDIYARIFAGAAHIR